MYEVHKKSRKSSHETVQVTNYRFQKSMNPDWETQPSPLYQAYAPASGTSIASVAGAALASSVDGHGLRFPLWHVTSSTAGHVFQDLFAPEEFTHKVPEMVPSEHLLSYHPRFQGAYGDNREIIWR